MRFASFRLHGQPGYGLVTPEGLRPVGSIFAARYPDLKSAIAAGVLEQAAGSARANPQPFDEEAITLEPVVPNPDKILCIGINFLAHMREMGHEPPDHPTVFTRFPNSLVGHGCGVVRPRVSEKYDFEGELAIVIGRQARYVTVEQALDHVAGYSCFMDGSVRDFQYHTTQFIAGKNFFASGAFGPSLVTADEVPDPAALELLTRLNGEVMQRACIGDMRFTVAQLIAYCSTFTRLEPGDVITSGSPSGVGAARKPPRWLQPGDVLEVELSGIGVLRNTVVAEAGDAAVPRSVTGSRPAGSLSACG